MQNLFLDGRTTADINARVAKVLRDLGNPEPPLRLELVLDLLELDKGYYSSSDDGLLRETAHRLKIAGKQVLKRPRLLLDVVKKLDLRALYIPDQRRILLDSELPSAKQRWGEAHEIGHSLLDWHEHMMHGDQERTLSLSCQNQLESEANFAAGRLIFLADEFKDRLLGLDNVSLTGVRGLAKEFGNTITSTLWRTVESLDVPAFALISQHPNKPRDWSLPAVRYFIRSKALGARFVGLSETELFSVIGSYCHGRRGPIGNSVVVLTDADGSEHEFFAETFFNNYEALTLGTYIGPRRAVVVVGNA